MHYFIEGPVDETIARHYFDEFHNRRETEVMPPFARCTARPPAWQRGWSVPHGVALERLLRQLLLTPGQLAVCREPYRGQAQAEIARGLRVAPSTVADHVRKLYRALELRSASELRALLDARIDESQP